MFGVLLLEQEGGLARVGPEELESRGSGWVFPGNDRVFPAEGVFKFGDGDGKEYWLSPGCALACLSRDEKQVKDFLFGVNVGYGYHLSRLLKPSPN